MVLTQTKVLMNVGNGDYNEPIWKISSDSGDFEENFQIQKCWFSNHCIKAAVLVL